MSDEITEREARVGMTALDTKALLPCPFCGEEADVDVREYTDDKANYGHAYAFCPACGIEQPYRMSEAEAAKAWNTRSAPRLARRVIELEEAVAHFIDIIDGTEETGFDPTDEQMLMDAADEHRAALKGEGG